MANHHQHQQQPPQPQPQPPQPRYKSEVFVPIRQDAHSFEERQKNIWEDMHERMEKRRREWEDEVTRMRRDFFRLKPDENRGGSSENLLEKMDLKNMFYDVKDGTKVFRVSFDVSQFQPDEINVKTQDQRLIVNARHEEKGSDKTVSREFSRQVDIPQNVDPLKLRSTLSKDGILQIEAEVSAPAYDRIRDTASRSSFNVAPSVSASVSSSHAPSASSPSASASGRCFLPSSEAQTVFDCGPSVTERDGSRTFRIALDVGPEFEPQDLTIKTVDRKLVVQARHEERTPGRTSCKEFSREFDLPESVDPNLVTASMTGEGKLVLEAPISSYTHGTYTGRPGCVKQPTVTLLLSPCRGFNP